MLNAYFRLSAFLDDHIVGKPVDLGEMALRETLLIASNFNEVRVNFICKTIEELGRCEMINSAQQRRFVIEKILRS